MEVINWAAGAVAGAASLAFARLWWSTRGTRLRKLQELIDLSKRTIEDKNDEIDRLRKADLLLREANQKLKDALSLEKKTLDAKHDEVTALKRALTAQRTANEKLNEILGNQEQHVRKLQSDVTMLTDQVSKLRAQLGLEP
jgi:HAMP domain-containing protein